MMSLSVLTRVSDLVTYPYYKPHELDYVHLQQVLLHTV